MPYRNAVYTAFYVSEPFNPTGLGPHGTRDFNYYELVCAWKASDRFFPFVDAHEKTYSVRDGSDWERTLKPRLHERLRASKTILLILSDCTRASRALSEEIEYGVGELRIPMVVTYPDLDRSDFHGGLSSRVTNLWDRLPALTRNIDLIPTLHIPFEKELVRRGLGSGNYAIQTAIRPDQYYYLF